MFHKIKLIALLLIGLFFLLVGVQLLIASYQLDNPFTFIISFFASNLMILISATLSLGFALRLFRGHDPHTEKESQTSDQD